MTRRSHLVRSDTTPDGIGVPRSFGGCTILCATVTCAELGGDGPLTIMTIPVPIATTYTRVFVSATIGGIEVSGEGLTQATVSIRRGAPDGGISISELNVPTGHNACLTGAVDLPTGAQSIFVTVSLPDFGSTGTIAGGNLQVIVGQSVTEPGCIAFEGSG